MLILKYLGGVKYWEVKVRGAWCKVEDGVHKLVQVRDADTSVRHVVPEFLAAVVLRLRKIFQIKHRELPEFWSWDFVEKFRGPQTPPLSA